ncbi:serine/threonine transporter SstT [Parvibacter caecicola]|uniref:serine/threonine transporter SstT n=1 Tax=Parvibacter caecicola TaxID=747645 RepID=UPI0023F25645|nr:serine/threonine transporter SstT [Parvibacter caecicola]
MDQIKNIVRKYNDISLIKRIIVGLIVGVVLALLIPIQAEPTGVNAFITLFGDVFVGALKGVAPILVFFLVLSALSNAKGEGTMGTVLVLYIVSTFVAAIVAVLASYVFPTPLTLDTSTMVEQTSPSNVGDVLMALIMNVVSNPVASLANANYLGILAWAAVLGIILRGIANDDVKNLFTTLADAVSTLVRWVIAFAPFGVMGLVYTSVGTNGPEIFIEYGRIILVLVGCMAFIALVTNPLIVFVCTRMNPYPLVLRCLKDSGLTAFFTRSSAANIPVNMALCEKLGLNKDNYSVSIPLGSTINMAGAAVTITVMTMAACHTMGISVDPITAVILSVLAAVSACGASGVAGGSLLLIPMCCALFGIDNAVAMQVVGIGFIIGVVQDSCETAVNSSSDVVFTATAEYRRMIKEGKQVRMGKDAFTADELDA